jgi:dTMP kinase
MIILCDRFTDSTYAYQVIGSNIDSHINEINKRYILNNLKPHLTIVLKSNIKTIFKRIKKRKIKNKFDKLKKNFYIKAQNCFINLAKNKKNYYTIDSSIDDNIAENIILKTVLKQIEN